MTEPTYVLVHGVGTSSLLWAPVQRELAAWAVEPSRLGTVTLEDNVETVLTAVRRLRSHGPVVVAASLGGVTITAVANREPVDGLVYISAWACVAHDNPYGYMTERSSRTACCRGRPA